MRKCKCGKLALWLKRNRKFMCDDCAVKAGLLIPCPGEAHRNPYIDHCMVCAPRWELVEVLPPISPEAERFINSPISTDTSKHVKIGES